MAVCNDSEIAEEDGQWKVTGEPTEGALRTLARKAGFADKDYERVAVIPFESENKFMATLNRVPGGGTRILLKGAPDRLLDRCPGAATGRGATEPLDRAFWEQQIEELSNQGLRVLAAAARDVDAGKAIWGWTIWNRTWCSSAWWESLIRRAPKPSRPSRSVSRPAFA
jgi:magnesium-transporting ATPase (P-type)